MDISKDSSPFASLLTVNEIPTCISGLSSTQYPLFTPKEQQAGMYVQRTI
jgi:hypothetical protein